MTEDDWRLPRSTGDLQADMRAADLARRTARTDAQRAAVAVRMESLQHRARADQAALIEQWREMCHSVNRRFEQGARAWAQALSTIGAQLAPIVENLERTRRTRNPGAGPPPGRLDGRGRRK